MKNPLNLDEIYAVSTTLGERVFNQSTSLAKPKTIAAESKPPRIIERREPFRGTDKRGQAIVYVPLAGGKHMAFLYAEDFDRIMAEGWSDQWHYLNNTRGRCYVRVRPHDVAKSKESVHRLVMQASTNEAVLFRSGNTLDLRKGNLSIRTKKQQQQPYVDLH